MASPLATPTRHLTFGLWFKLSFMMFLQYAIWGAWLPLLYPFLSGYRGFTPGQIGDMFAVGALGAILAPWVAGQIADRYFNTEHYLAFAHLVGGVLVYQLYWISDYWAFLGFSFLYSLIYAPTLSLTNSISFHHLPDRDRHFGWVRVWGTVGWIAVGIGVGQWLAYQHSPSFEGATQQLTRELLEPKNRMAARTTYEVTYKDKDGNEQKVIGTPADESEMAFARTAAAGETPAEQEALVIDRGTTEKPDLLAIKTESITKIENRQTQLDNQLQPELKEEFYETVNETLKSLGVKPGDENPPAQADAPAARGGGGAMSATALEDPVLPTPLVPAESLDAVVKAVNEHFADEARYTVFNELHRDFTGVQPGDPVLLEFAGAPLKERVFVQKSGGASVFRNPATGELEAYGSEAGFEGYWPVDPIRIVGIEKPSTDEEVVEIMEKGAAEDARRTRIDRLNLLSQERYGLFRASAVDALTADAQQEGMADAFRASAVLGILLGLFCFFLPRTPPQRGRQSSATAEALGEIRKQPLITLFLLAVPISCIHQFYFVHASTFVGEYQRQAEGLVASINSVFGVGGGGLMTIGQMTEMLVLALIPFYAKRLSRKTLLGAGIVAYGLRMFLFAYADTFPLSPLVTVVLGIALHGFCFGCFIFVAFMIVDEETTGDVRASAQTLFNLVIVGIGIIVGSKIAGWTAEWASASGAMDYTKLFAVPMWGAVGCLAFLIFFYPRKKKLPVAPVDVAE